MYRWLSIPLGFGVRLELTHDVVSRKRWRRGWRLWFYKPTCRWHDPSMDMVHETGVYYGFKYAWSGYRDAIRLRATSLTVRRKSIYAR